ncbi:MAG: type VI secretion system-associated FHA domain protein TagH [Lautropia sp.]
MASIRVVARSGQPLAAPLSAQFGPEGGTIGRSAECTLALPDERRMISRQQARIETAGGRMVIVCTSSAAPLLVNGRAYGHGERHPLAHDDRIQIGDYELCFDDPAAGSATAAVAGPFGDPFADPFAEPSAEPSPGRFAQPSSQPFAEPSAASPFDPPRDPLHDLLRDPMAGPVADPLAAATRGSPSAADPLGLGALGQPMTGSVNPVESVDQLFGLQASADPFAPGSPLGEPAEPSRTPPGGALPDRPMRDDAPILSQSFRLPTSEPLPPQQSLQRPSHQPRQQPPPQQSPPQQLQRPQQQPEPRLRPAEAQPHHPRPAAAVVSWQTGAVPEGAGAVTDSDALLAALLDGLGLSELPRGAGMPPGTRATLTPELMQRLGVLVATSIDGLVGLLQVRATLKRELRTDVTMVAAADNNPLKFAPDGQSALLHLLAAQSVRGFMAPGPAIADACDDLRAHQLAFVAGLRAALQGLIARFDPAALENRLAPRSMLDSLRPAARKAQLWTQFEALYGEVSREAQDDFDRLFGRAFVTAYEAQVARLQTEAGRKPRGDRG